jgi:phosphate transport system substrate-binding protein
MKKKNKYLIGIIAIIVIIAGALIISADAGSSKVQVAGSTQFSLLLKS